MLLKDEIQNNKLLMLGKLAASLAHEIRNPLSALKINLDYLSLSNRDFNEEISESIDTCIEATERIQNLIDDTLEFSRAADKDVRLYLINEVAEQAITIVRSSSKRKKIRIEADLNQQLSYLSFNKNKILQVVLNLITNAVEASSPGNVVKVKTYLSDNENIILEVEDNGTGIRNEDKNKIFKDFFTTKVDGTGLGLTVCKMLLSDHKARIEFKSKVGEGSKFFIKFPKQTLEVKNEAKASDSR